MAGESTVCVLTVSVCVYVFQVSAGFLYHAGLEVRVAA